MNNNKLLNKIRNNINSTKERSAWNKGVKAYALELVDRLAEDIAGGYLDADDLNSERMTEKAMLNGAADWEEYSEGGCALVYNYDIAQRLCNPSELKRTKEGLNRPNSRENWIDVQTRALFQAAQMVKKAIKEALNK